MPILSRQCEYVYKIWLLVIDTFMIAKFIENGDSVSLGDVSSVKSKWVSICEYVNNTLLIK